MQNFKFKPLPLSCSDISLLRQSGMIYVDKSDLICRLCSRINAQIFLSRPRRFGKSLLVSTFESLFKYGLRDFQGLHIEITFANKPEQAQKLLCDGLSHGVFPMSRERPSLKTFVPHACRLF